MNHQSEYRTWPTLKACLVLGAALVILSFSLHSGADSNLQSEHIEQIIAHFAHKVGIYHPNLHFLQLLYPQESHNLGNLLLRKLSHFTEYLIFGVLCTFIFRKMRNRKLAVALNIAAGPLLALCDEKIVQAYLSVGRTSSYRDVLLDSFGFFTGALLALLVCLLLSLPVRKNL